jgi:hypothetical protein
MSGDRIGTDRISPLPTNLWSEPGEGQGVRAARGKGEGRGEKGEDGLLVFSASRILHPSSVFASPHPSPLPEGEGTTASRRGAILVVILVCFVIAATLFVVLARSAISQRRAAETRYWNLQAQWLGEAALERAAARSATDPKYDGETWRVPAAEFAASQGGTVKIEVAKDDDPPGRRLVRVEAFYPDDPVHCCRWEKQVVMDREASVAPTISPTAPSIGE